MNNQELFLAKIFGLEKVSCYPYVWLEKEREGEDKVKKILIDGIAHIVQKVTIEDEIQDVLNTLGEREKQILNLYFGLKDGKCRTHEEIGKDYRVSKTRTGQIIRKSLSRLRHQSRHQRLKYLIIPSPKDRFIEKQKEKASP